LPCDLVLYCVSQFGMQYHVYIDYAFGRTLSAASANILLASFHVFLAFLAKMNILIFVSHRLTPLLVYLLS